MESVVKVLTVAFQVLNIFLLVCLVRYLFHLHRMIREMREDKVRFYLTMRELLRRGDRQ